MRERGKTCHLALRAAAKHIRDLLRVQKRRISVIFISKLLLRKNRRQIGNVLHHLLIPLGVCRTDKLADAFGDVLLPLVIPEGVGQDMKAAILSAADDILHRLPPTAATVGEVLEVVEKVCP